MVDRFFNFKGRAGRKEYLLQVVLCTLLVLVGFYFAPKNILFLILAIIGAIGMFTIIFRRSHDVSGDNQLAYTVLCLHFGGRMIPLCTFVALALEIAMVFMPADLLNHKKQGKK